MRIIQGILRYPICFFDPYKSAILEKTLQIHSDLVILRAGKNSVHSTWRAGIPAFDLIIFGYEDIPSELTKMAAEVITIPGPKISSWAKLFATRPELLETYQQIALLDDDLLCSIDDLNASFAAGRAYNLLLWQPSLSWDSFFTYGVTLHNPNFTLRYVNFVELMCPFFAASQLKLVLPLFSLGYEVYVDRIWCRLNKNWRQHYAILDSVQFKHCRRIGVNAEAQGFSVLKKTKRGGIYQTYIDQVEADLQLRFRGPVAYAGITRRGKLVAGRIIMAIAAFSVLRGWGRHRENKFVRPLLDHVRHNLTRPIDNEPIALNSPSPNFSHKTINL